MHRNLFYCIPFDDFYELLMIFALIYVLFLVCLVRVACIFVLLFVKRRAHAHLNGSILCEYYVKANEIYSNTAPCGPQAVRRQPAQLSSKFLIQICGGFFLLLCETRTRVKTTNLRPVTPTRVNNKIRRSNNLELSNVKKKQLRVSKYEENNSYNVIKYKVNNGSQ